MPRRYATRVYGGGYNKENEFNRKGASRFNKKVIIQSLFKSADAYGQMKTASWTDWKEVWAEVMIEQGGEYYGAKRNIPELSGIVTIRYLRGVKSSMRINYDGRMFDIMSVIPKGRELREFIEMHVKEVFA
jgi:SPP1 family predicted phage head-tail adaptor